MKSSRILLIIGILMITLLSIYTRFLLQEKKQIEESYQAAIQADNSNDARNSVLLSNLYELQKASWIHGIYGINRQTILTNKDASKIKFIEKLNGLTLLFSFDSNMCSPCIDREVENMKRLIARFKNINLIITTQGLPHRYIFNDEKFKGLESNIFTVAQNPLEAGRLVDSPTFALFRNETILFIYHPDKNHNQAFEAFMEVLETTQVE